MSKNRKECYETAIGLAWLFAMISLASVCVRYFRGMDMRISLFWVVLSGGLFLMALLIHEWENILALPQAVWMAIQDRRNKL